MMNKDPNQKGTRGAHSLERAQRRTSAKTASAYVEPLTNKEDTEQHHITTPTYVNPLNNKEDTRQDHDSISNDENNIIKFGHPSPSEGQGRNVDVKQTQNALRDQLAALRQQSPEEFDQALAQLGFVLVANSVNAKGGVTAPPNDSISPVVPTKLKERRAFLDKYYSGRAPWALARGDNPTPAIFLEWANDQFSDRETLGLSLSDLKHLDRPAYDKICYWAKPGDEGKPTATGSDFGFPINRNSYDVETLLATAPTGAEVFDAYRNADPRAPELMRLYTAANYHRKHLTP